MVDKCITNSKHNMKTTVKECTCLDYIDFQVEFGCYGRRSSWLPYDYSKDLLLQIIHVLSLPVQLWPDRNTSRTARFRGTGSDIFKRKCSNNSQLHYECTQQSKYGVKPVVVSWGVCKNAGRATCCFW